MASRQAACFPILPTRRSPALPVRAMRKVIRIRPGGDTSSPHSSPMRILTCSETREAASGPEATPQLLMRRAGYAVAQFCASQFKFSSVCVLCGTGDIGGAGLIAAEALQRFAETVAVIILAKQADELSPDVAACLGPGIQPIWIAEAADFASGAAQRRLAPI